MTRSSPPRCRHQHPGRRRLRARRRRTPNRCAGPRARTLARAVLPRARAPQQRMTRCDEGSSFRAARCDISYAIALRSQTPPIVSQPSSRDGTPRAGQTMPSPLAGGGAGIAPSPPMGMPPVGAYKPTPPGGLPPRAGQPAPAQKARPPAINMVSLRGCLENDAIGVELCDWSRVAWDALVRCVRGGFADRAVGILRGGPGRWRS
jgi:hypothetical protein